VLEERVDKGIGAVVSQILNVYLRAVSVEMKLREVENLERRMEEIEALVAARKERPWGAWEGGYGASRVAQEGAVLVHQRDGTVRAFDKMHVMAEVYLAQLDAALGRPRRSSDVLRALDGATRESRRVVEEMSACGFTGDLDLEQRESVEPVEPVEDLSEWP
jgi:hypothetical protein